MRQISFPLLLLLYGFLAAFGAHAKSASWQDCFFREFDLCVGRAPEPGSDDKANDRTACYGKAHAACDEEEKAKEVKKAGVSANEAKKGDAVPASPPSGAAAKPTQQEEVLAGAESAVVEGITPSGDNTVLGLDVTLPIFEVAERYRERNVRGCRPIEDPFTRILCVDAPGASGGRPIELEYYRGRLAALRYDGAAVKFRAAVDVAEEKTATKAVMSTTADKACRARFPLGGGTLVLRSAAAGSDPCVADTALEKVEWRPSMAAQAAIEEARKADRAPASSTKKSEDTARVKAELPL